MHFSLDGRVCTEDTSLWKWCKLLGLLIPSCDPAPPALSRDGGWWRHPWAKILAIVRYHCTQPCEFDYTVSYAVDFRDRYELKQRLHLIRRMVYSGWPVVCRTRKSHGIRGWEKWRDWRKVGEMSGNSKFGPGRYLIKRQIPPSFAFSNSREWIHTANSGINIEADLRCHLLAPVARRYYWKRRRICAVWKVVTVCTAG